MVPKPSDSRLASLYRVEPRLTGQVSRVGACIDAYGELPQYFFGAFDNPIGVEVEMEGCVTQTILTANASKCWDVVDDGSLRNIGKEFVSVPLSGHTIDYALHELKKIFDVTPTRSWSIRTSIHVHANVSTMRCSDLVGLTALYAVFEKLFFSMVAPEREANPYCYPLTSVPPDEIVVVDQQKYCAFNIAPVRKQLTVEFRHMHGNEDIRLIKRWLQMICKLVRYVLRNGGYKVVQEIYDLPKTQRHLDLLKSVFGANAVLFKDKPVTAWMNDNLMWAIAHVEIH